jgi:uncharacterized membrane protein YjfL (UPF0719 family)
MVQVLAVWRPDTFVEFLGAAAVWSLLGIILLLFGYKLFDWMLRKVDFDAELAKGNTAVAIVAGAMIIAIAIIIHAAIS